MLALQPFWVLRPLRTGAGDGTGDPAATPELELLDADGLQLLDSEGATLLAGTELFVLAGGGWFKFSDGTILGVAPA